MHTKTRKAALLVTTALVLTIPAGSALATSGANQTVVDHGIAYLNAQQSANGSIPGPFGDVSDWAAVAYASAGTDPATVKQARGTSLLDFIKASPPTANASATDWERAILAITAAGQDPYSFAGINYVSTLEKLHTEGQIGDAGVDNDDIFGVLALISANVPKNDATLTDALKTVTTNQRKDGSFSWSTSASDDSDVDDTASALMALQAANNAGLNVDPSAISSAKAYLLSKQNSDGGFLSDPAYSADSNVSTSSWALMALNALGDGNTSDGLKAQSYLRAAQQQDGSFPYTTPGAGDTGDTASALNALSGGFWPLRVWSGPIPEGDAGSVLGSQTSPTVPPSANPSQSPSIIPTVPAQHPAVLDASTSSTASGSKVLGAGTTSRLPVTGGSAGLLAVLAFIMSLAAGTVSYLRSRKATRTDVQ